ncbi:nucleolar protein 6-like [Lineus longissimus]|uniref:nucleolar protein 6-like n=1 Tax=Lineus longissimus TaxID=88925 RepID=UPI002B4DD86F
MKRSRQSAIQNENDDEGSDSVSDNEESSSGSESDSPDEQSLEPQPSTSKCKREDVQSPPLKMAKLTKGELYKPPTNEELNELKEAEDLFQSSLFRMQISELLNEVKVKESKAVTEFLHKLTDVLTGMEAGKMYDLTDQRWCRKMKIKVPLHQEPFRVKGKFSFHPPSKVTVLGSFVMGTCVEPDPHIDVAVEMPVECLQAKDHMNERYLRKRALYLCHIAGILKGHDLVKDVKFTYHHGNHMKPILVIKPAGKAGKLVTIRLHTSPAKGFFKMSKFLINKNNIRQSWYTGVETEEKEDAVSAVPTPHYNTTILADMTMEDHQKAIMGQLHERDELKKGAALLKVWLHQRELDMGHGSFSGFIMTMLVVYLLSKQRLNRMMSSYQVLRNTLLELAKLNLDVEGISLCHPTNGATPPSVEEFHKHFGVVFVDSTGFVNLCANVTKNTFQRVKQEANISVETLDNPTIDGIECLLLSKVPFSMKFDHIFHLTHMEHLQSAVGKLKLQRELMDHSGDYIHTVLPHILSLVMQALGSRVTLLAPKLEAPKEWAVNSDPPLCNLVDKVTFGLLLDTAHSTSVLEKGPPADTHEAKVFHQFWGEKSELRRFQDGSICEAVVWSCKTLAEQRLVCARIIKYILEKSADISTKSIRYIGGQLDSILQPAQPKKKFIHYGTGEEQNIGIMKMYNNLSKQIRQLKDWPLSVTSISGIDPVFRFAEVFPTVPLKQLKKEADLTLVWPDGTMRPWSQSMRVVVMLEGSGKWPEDREAIKRVKAAFHIKLAEMLEESYKFRCRVAVDHVLVLKSGFVFEVHLAYYREVTIAKMVKTPEGMVKMVDTKESLELEEVNLTLPQLTSALHSVQQKHNTFSGAVRLAKRWIAAQMLSGFLRDEAVELVVASLYIKPAPFTVPSCPQTGFLRFLNLLTRQDWRLSPVIVNLNEDLKSEDYREIQTNFTKHRSSLPLMFIATPYDKLKSIWTLHKPTAPILQRLVLLAQESLNVLQSQFMLNTDDMDRKLIFRPPLDIYNVLIHLKPAVLTRRSQCVDPDPDIQYPQFVTEVDESLPMPAVNFDPVACYLRELRAAFDAIALFFHDEFGGDVVGVLWKPGALDVKPFKIKNLNYHTPVAGKDGKEDQIVANIEAILEDFKIIGEGLVKSVQRRTGNGEWENVGENNIEDS